MVGVFHLAVRDPAALGLTVLERLRWGDAHLPPRGRRRGGPRRPAAAGGSDSSARAQGSGPAGGADPPRSRRGGGRAAARQRRGEAPAATPSRRLRACGPAHASWLLPGTKMAAARSMRLG